MAGKKRNGIIDFWKFFFSVVIVLFHSKNLAAEGEIHLFKSGNLCVEFFFIVSGIFLAMAVEKQNARELRTGESGYSSMGKETFSFILHKIKGLLPNIYVALPIAFLVEHIGLFSIRKLVVDMWYSVWEIFFATETGMRYWYSNDVTWYISAMLLVMMILYPIMRKLKDNWFYLVGPLVFLFLMGWTFKTYDGLSAPHEWTGLVFKGLLRATMNLTLGTLLFRIGNAMKSVRLTHLSRVILTLVENTCYLLTTTYMMISGNSHNDWMIVVMFGVAILISYSHQSYSGNLLDREISSKLGTFSLSLYLGHGFWSHKMKWMLPHWNYWGRLPVYLLLAFATGAFIYFVSLWLKRFWEEYGEDITALFIR